MSFGDRTRGETGGDAGRSVLLDPDIELAFPDFDDPSALEAFRAELLGEQRELAPRFEAELARREERLRFLEDCEGMYWPELPVQRALTEAAIAQASPRAPRKPRSRSRQIRSCLAVCDRSEAIARWGPREFKVYWMRRVLFVHARRTNSN
jgi:hypothetical protein